MKQLILAFILFPAILFSQITYTIDSVDVGPLYTIKATQALSNGQTNVEFDPGEYDTTSLVSYLIRRTEEAYRSAANNQIAYYRAEREGKQLQSLVQGFVDTLYFNAMQDKYANDFVAQSASDPNMRLRVGGTFHWLKGFISNGLFRVERVQEDGTLQSPRDIAAMYWLSNKSIRIQPIDVTNETVFLYYDALTSDNVRDIYRGQMQDGTLLTLVHFKSR